MNTIEVRSPLEVEADLDQAMVDLDQLGKDYDVASEALTEAEDDWTAHMDAVIASLEDEMDRLPGEAKIESKARRFGNGASLWSDMRRAEREVKRLEKQMTRAGNAISGCQTKLKQVRSENGGSY